MAALRSGDIDLDRRPGHLSTVTSVAGAQGLVPFGADGARMLIQKQRPVLVLDHEALVGSA